VRISSFEIHRQATAQLQNLGAQAANTQQQIASGRRIVNPSDDPVGAARAIEINQELRSRAQYVANSELADNTLALEDSVLAQVTSAIHRVQELTIQAGSGVQTVEDQRFIAAEIQTRFEELVALANTRGADGQFIFSGFATDTPPFAVNGNEVVYQGDSGQRQLFIDRGQTITLNDTGDELFVRVASNDVNLSAASIPAVPGRSEAALSGLEVVDQDLIDAFFPDELVVKFNPLEEAGGEVNFSVLRASDARPVDGLVNVVYGSGNPIVAQGASFQVTGSPQVGDQFVVATNRQQGLLQTVKNIGSQLGSIDPQRSPDAFQNLLDVTIEGLEQGLGNVLTTRAEIGARLNTMEAVRDQHEDLTVQLTQTLSEIQDLDFAEAVSNLSYQSFVLEAAQQSFIRINNLSLFNRL